QYAGGLVIAVIIHRRRRDHHFWTALAQDLSDPASRYVVVEHRHVPKLHAEILGADGRRGGSCLSAPDGRDFVRGVVLGAAIPGRHRGERDLMTTLGEQRHGSSAENFDVIGMSVN